MGCSENYHIYEAMYAVGMQISKVRHAHDRHVLAHSILVIIVGHPNAVLCARKRQHIETETNRARIFMW